ncbi:Helix-turn-helix domain-containing protein [Chryseobacterium arachidis]|uniref:Helix-turn-helix domain-containing protein n=1 Tax=Chryseobacterium arachidis TaxID=1416778 RepID=A0A1M5C9A2_9FLAO|nr:helix-turn-helix domain-containing protein [Chryseobacterium arachidis]SHF51236.1 Helix-turn-helix domain-containing protein [Chryseobacterium arachidis]
MRFFTLLFTFFVLNLYGQDIASFNAIYTKTFLETSQKDPDKALKIADSLYTISETPVLQTKSLMLTATLYHQLADFEKALQYASKAEKIIQNTDNVLWKAKVYGFMATHYRFIRLFDQSKKYFEMGLNISTEIPNPELANNTMAMMMQEKAYYNIEKKDYHNSIKSIEKSEEYVLKTSVNADHLKITNQQLLGYCYYHLGNFKVAFRHYREALKLSKNFPENYSVGLIHNGLALLYLQENDLKKAKEHLDITLRITEESKNPSLKNEVYETSEKYYALTKNLEDYVKTREKHDTVKKTLQKNMQYLVNKSYSRIDQENTEIKSSSDTKNLIIGTALIIFLIGIVLFLGFRKKQKKNIQNFEKVIRELNEKKLLNSAIENTKEIAETPKTAPNSLMPIETEQKILALLQQFEGKELYLDNNVSLSSLATYCETNGKYLSYVINTYKNNDFNNYINVLRINYIVDKLRNYPIYRKYKIATLAEEAGFSSLNKFSTVFKKTISLTPSLFIKYLNEENSENTIEGILKLQNFKE